MGVNRTIFELVDPLIELLRPISGIAWIPLGMFVLGVGEALPTAIMFYGAFFLIVINSVVGVRLVDPGLVDAARVLGLAGNRAHAGCQTGGQLRLHSGSAAP